MPLEYYEITQWDNMEMKKKILNQEDIKVS